MCQAYVSFFPAHKSPPFVERSPKVVELFPICKQASTPRMRVRRGHSAASRRPEPGVPLTRRTGTSLAAAQAAGAAANLLSWAIVEGNASHPSMNSLVLNTDFLVCVMSADNPLSRNALVTLEELKRERMILRLPTSATRELFDSSLRSMKDSPDNYNIILEVDNIATIKDLVRKNLGVSVLPQSACLKELRKGSLTALPIENLSMVRETRLVYNRDFRRKDILRIFFRTERSGLKPS